MKVKFSCICILVIITSLLSCQKQNEQYFNRVLDDFIQASGSVYNLDDLDGWEVSTVFEGMREGTVDVLYTKNDIDTLKSLALFIDKSTDQPQIDGYYKRYFTGSYSVELYMTRDTVYCFKETDGSKDFIVGGYNYKFTHMDLEPFELDYYVVHKDSLGKVRGNKLPLLPRMSKELADSLLSRMGHN